MRQPGVYDIGNDDYHADKDYFSSSQFKVALESQALFKHDVLEGKARKESTGAMDLGSLTHTVVLEPWKVDDEYVIYSGDVNKDGGIPKSVVTDYAKKYPGKTVVSKAWYEFATKARGNIESYPEAKDLFYANGCVYEKSIFIKDAETGLPIRVRPDVLNVEAGYVVDLKTAADVSLFQFKRAVSYTFHYDLSAYMYMHALFQQYGKVFKWYFGVIGKHASAPIAIYEASDATILDGKKKYYKAADNIKEALLLPDNYNYQTKIEVI